MRTFIEVIEFPESLTLLICALVAIGAECLLQFQF
jgi:hypothetical protein